MVAVLVPTEGLEFTFVLSNSASMDLTPSRTEAAR